MAQFEFGEVKTARKPRPRSSAFWLAALASLTVAVFGSIAYFAISGPLPFLESERRDVLKNYLECHQLGVKPNAAKRIISFDPNENAVLLDFKIGPANTSPGSSAFQVVLSLQSKGGMPLSKAMIYHVSTLSDGRWQIRAVTP